MLKNVPRTLIKNGNFTLKKHFWDF